MLFFLYILFLLIFCKGGLVFILFILFLYFLFKILIDFVVVFFFSFFVLLILELSVFFLVWGFFIGVCFIWDKRFCFEEECLFDVKYWLILLGIVFEILLFEVFFEVDEIDLLFVWVNCDFRFILLFIIKWSLIFLVLFLFKVIFIFDFNFNWLINDWMRFWWFVREFFLEEDGKIVEISSRILLDCDVRVFDVVFVLREEFCDFFLICFWDIENLF